MEVQLTSVIIAFLISLLCAGAFYYKLQKFKETKGWLVFILFTLRFFVLFFLIFLLFKPLLVAQKKIEQKPIVPILIDNSFSQTIIDSNYLNKVHDLVKSVQLKNEGVVSFPIVDLQKPTQIEKLLINSTTTNLHEGFETIDNLYGSANIAGVVLISDGIINEGLYPPVIPFKVPIYSVFAGDTSKIPDAKVLKIFHNDVVFKNNKFPIEINASFKKLKGVPCSVSYQFSDSVILTEVVTPLTDDYFLKKKLKLSTQNTGKIPFSVKIKPAKREVALKNNIKTQFINVLDGKRRVAIVYDYLSPEIRAIARVLNKRDYDLHYFSFKDASKRVNDEDLLIIVGNGDAEEKAELLSQLDDTKKGFIWFTGVNGAFKNSFFDFTRLDDAFDDVRGVYNDKYTGIVTSKNHVEVLSQLTPIAVPFGRWNVKKVHQNAIFQKVNGVLTNYPLIVSGENEYQNFTLFIGEGYWRWPLQEGGDDVFKELLLRHIEIVADKSDQTLIQSKSLDNYSTVDEVSFEVLAYNEARQLDNSRGLELVLNDSLTYQLLKGTNTFVVNLGALTEGVYSYKIKDVVKNKVELNARFIVSESILEQEDLQGKPSVLQKISADSKGDYFTLDQKDDLVSKLTNEVKYTSISYFESSKELLLNNKWILYLLITLVAFEWFIRKWQGKI